jgi:hypothetical protein
MMTIEKMSKSAIFDCCSAIIIVILFAAVAIPVIADDNMGE